MKKMVLYKMKYTCWLCAKDDTAWGYIQTGYGWINSSIRTVDLECAGALVRTCVVMYSYGIQRHLQSAALCHICSVNYNNAVMTHCCLAQ